MARKPQTTDYRRLMCDRLDDIDYPGEHRFLLGHDKALAEFNSAYKTHRMHHAWLISGPRGVGKATFALSVAAHLLRYQDAGSAPAEIPVQGPDDDKFNLIGRGGHPNVLHITRPQNPKTGKFRTTITIDEIRKIRTFFSRTRIQDSWRICIIDSADELNTSATNALLKILEEPPERTLFFVLANHPGRLLPTIRSRCRQLQLRPLNPQHLGQALELLNINLSDLDDRELDTLHRLSHGSVRKAIILLRLEGIALYHQFCEILAGSNAEGPDWVKVHKLADELSRVNKDEQFRLLLDITRHHISHTLYDVSHSQTTNSPDSENKSDSQNASKTQLTTHIQQSMLSHLARLCEVWEKTAASVSLVDSYNLDRKQVILNLFGSLARVH